MTLTLTEFLTLLEPDARVFGLRENVLVTGVSIDTRTLQQGEVYVALKGERFDGHEFVPDAVRKKTSACVVRADWAIPENLAACCVFIKVEDPLRALQKIAENYRLRFNIPVLAITGTNGKTTTKELTGVVLEQKYSIVKSPGNLNNHIGLPLSLMRLEPETELAVVEMGTNHFGEIHQLCQIGHPTHGLITNIGAGHLEFFGTVDDVARAKAELFENLPPDGVAFVNIDDPRIVQIAEVVQNKVTFGYTPKADIAGEFLGLNENGCARIRINASPGITLQIPGKHQIGNALAAAAVGIFWKVPMDRIVQALENFRSYSKRMEIINFDDKIVLLDAYNSNPDSLKAAIETLVQIATRNGGRAIAVLGDMLELGEVSEESHFEAGLFAAQQGVEELFAYGTFADQYVEGFKMGGGKHVSAFSDKDTLAQELLRNVKTNDVVLIKGSRGMAMETVWHKMQKAATK